MEQIFFDITVIVCLAAALSLVFRILKQPPILAYLLTGIIIGPLSFLTAQNQDAIRSMADIGITLLLFTLGLELKISDLKSVGRVSVVAGFLQIGLTLMLAFPVAILLGFSVITSIYVALALTFSSTIIIVKLLSDKKDLASLYGKISVGILLIQDFFAIAALIFLSGFSTDAQISPYAFLILALKTIVIFGWAYVVGRFVLPALIERIARSSELLFLFSLAWVFGLSAFIASPIIGFSIEIGGFLAGVSLANTSENYQIAAKVRSLRDFFIIIFFVTLGTQMAFLANANIILPIIVLLVTVIVLKPIIIMGILFFLGHRKRVAFLSSVSFAQISEFSLITIFAGQRFGKVPQDVASVITIVAAVSFVVSTYFMIYSEKLYKIFLPYLDKLEKDKTKNGPRKESLKDHIILIGANRMGESVVKALTDSGEKFVVIDFNPDIIKKLEEDGITSFFGDIIDEEIQDIAGLDKAKLVISTVPDTEDNILLLEAVGKLNKKPRVLVAAFEKLDAKELYNKGADYVVLPHMAGGHHLAKIITEDKQSDLIKKYKEKDLKEIL